MKKTQFIDLVQIIKKNIVAFVSICLFVMLAVGLFLGIGFSSDATKQIADKIAANGNYHDLDVMYPYGFSSDDIASVKQTSDSLEVEGYYYAYEFLNVNGNKNQINVKQITSLIDSLYNIEGTLPSKKGEIAVEKTTAEDLGISIGDTIAFEEDTSENLEVINQTLSFDSIESLMEKETGSGFLSTYTYTVTAIVNSSVPMHNIKNMFGVSYSNGLNIDGFMYVVEDSFKKEAFTGYPGMLIKDKSLSELSLFSDEYKTKLNELRDNVSSVIGGITNNKNTLVLSSVDNVIKAADEKLKKAKDQIDEGEVQIVNGEKQISNGEYQIKNGQSQIVSNTKKLNEGQAQISDAENKIKDGESQIAEKEKLLEDAKVQIEDGKAQISEAESQIAEKESELEYYQNIIDSIKSLVDSKIDKSFKDSDSIIDQVKEKDLDSLSKDELVNNLKSIIDSTYTLFTDQGRFYAELYRFSFFDEVFVGSNFYEVMKDIPLIRGSSYISSYLSNHEDTTASFSNRDKYIENVDLIDDILSSETYDEVDCNKLANAIEAVVINNKLDECKNFIYDPILIEFYESDEQTLRDTINYLISSYDSYKNDYNNVKSIVDSLLASYQEELDSSRSLLDEYKLELESKKKELEDGISAYNDGLAKLENAKSELSNAKNELAKYKNELESGKSELSAAVAKLESAKIELENAKLKLSSAKEELEDAKEQYSDGKKTVDDFKKTREELKSYDASYISSLDNPSISSFEIISNILYKVKYTMASLFLIIGLLVCYFSILRMVNEHIKLIGTKKALGFFTSEISRTYLLFTGISTIVGCLFGVIIGTFVIQGVIMSSIVGVTTFNGTVFDFKALEAIVICLMEIVLLLGITYGATKLILKENAISLLAGPKPPSGKKHFYEKLAIWKNVSLFNKTIVNNCLADKRRVFGTLVGVCGCTALIVTALTLNDALAKNFNKQFNELFHFDYIVYYDGDSAKGELNEILANYSIPKSDVLKTCTTITDNNGNSLYAYLIVPEDEDEFKKLVDMESLTNKDSDPYKGLWVAYSYKNTYGDSINDEFKLNTLSGVSADIRASGYFGYYLTVAQIFMDKDTYSNANNGTYSTNAILIDSSDIDIDSLSKELSKVDGFIQLENFTKMHKEAFDVIQGLAYAIVGVYATLSVAMAILVLLNLYMMFVSEKKKELITLMINGYSVKDARKYITKDTVLLTGIGVILGMILGTVFGFISIDTFNNYAAYVYKEIDILACLIGAIASILLSFVMCKIALKRVNKFKLSDINN